MSVRVHAKAERLCFGSWSGSICMDLFSTPVNRNSSVTNCSWKPHSEPIIKDLYKGGLA